VTGVRRRRWPSAPTAPCPPAAHGHSLLADLDCDRFVADMDERGQLTGTSLERGDEEPVLDIVAERIEPDLAGGKASFPGAHQPRGGVDDPHDPRGRGMLATVVPDAQRLERLHRTLEQGAGAVIPRGGGIGNQHGLDPAGGKRDRRGQAGRATADNDDFGHQAAHAAPIFKIDSPLALIPEDRQRLSGSRGGTVRSLRRAHQRGRHSLNLSRLLNVRRT
jgi:hypothetical protein